MSDTSPASTPAKKTAAKKAAKPKMTHPKYIDMVVSAIKTLSDRGGSSRQAILKYITENYEVGDSVKPQLKMCLKRGVTSGVLVHAKGQGASGSFKLAGGTDKKSAPKKPSTSKASKTKKSVQKAKKPAPKKATKSPAKKSTPKKKPVAKKVTKSPAKKSTPKAAAKAKKSPKKATKTKKPAKK